MKTFPVTVLFFPCKPMAVIDKSGCPLTLPQLKDTPESHPFSSSVESRSLCHLHTLFVHIRTRREKNKISTFPFNPSTALYHQGLVT